MANDRVLTHRIRMLEERLQVRNQRVRRTGGRIGRRRERVESLMSGSGSRDNPIEFVEDRAESPIPVIPAHRLGRYREVHIEDRRGGDSQSE